jgi:hypothetical protein
MDERKKRNSLFWFRKFQLFFGNLTLLFKVKSPAGIGFRSPSSPNPLVKLV